MATFAVIEITIKLSPLRSVTDNDGILATLAGKCLCVNFRLTLLVTKLAALLFFLAPTKESHAQQSARRITNKPVRSPY